MELSQRLAKRMQALKMTQKQLAEATGLAQSAISKYVRGKAKPGYEAIVGLSKALGVDVSWFFRDALNVDKRSNRQRIVPSVRPHQSVDVILFPSLGKVPKDTTFVIGHWLPMRDFPPPTRFGATGIITNFYLLVFNQLVQWVPPGQLRGALAVNFKPMGNSWVFQLREGVWFHDGRLFTAEDVAWSYEQYLKQNLNELRIKEIEILDPSFIAIHLNAPYQLQEVPMPGIIPYGTMESDNSWIGTGPFQSVSMTEGVWRLERNRNFFFFPPLLKGVEIREYPSADALEAALASGEVHFAIGVSHEGEEFITKGETAAMRFQLEFALNRPLAGNRTLREAIALALDKEALANAAFLKEPLYSVGSFDYIRNDRAQKPSPPHPQAARHLIKEMELSPNSVFRIADTQSFPHGRSLVGAIVEQLNRIGLKAEVGSPPDAWVVIRPVELSEQEASIWRSESPNNLNGYSNPKVDRLLQQFSKVHPTSKQLLSLRGLIEKDVPAIPLFYYETPLTYVKNLRALENRIILMSAFNEMYTWYLEACEPANSALSLASSR
jgi:ABC-type transport system substrate-binding protein/plasmid maintenance system antidote protein VapI